MKASCKTLVFLLSPLLLFGIAGMSQEIPLPPDEPGNGNEAPDTPRVVVNAEHTVTVRDTIVHTLLRNPAWPDRPVWESRFWNREWEGITNRFGCLVGAYGVLIHESLSLRLPIELNHDGIVDYQVDSEVRFDNIGEPWTVGIWTPFHVAATTLKGLNGNIFRVIPRLSPDPDKARAPEPWAVPSYSGEKIGTLFPFDTPSSFGTFCSLMKSVLLDNSRALQKYGGIVCTLMVPYYNIHTPLFEGVLTYIGLQFKIGSKTHYGWIKMESLLPPTHFSEYGVTHIPFGTPGDLFVSEYAYKLRPDTPIRAGASALPPPRIESISPTENGTMALTWAAEAGRGYQTEFRENLVSSPWTPVTGLRIAGQLLTRPDFFATETSMTVEVPWMPGFRVYRLVRLC